MAGILARMEAIADWIEELNEGVGRAVAWLIPAMAALMFAVVVAAFAFNAGSIAAQEAVGYLHALIFLTGAGYTLKHDGHVRVDILYRRWSARRRALVDLVGSLVLLLPLFTAILIYSWPYVTESWLRLEASEEAGGLPLVFLLKTFIPLGAILMLLQGLATAIRCFAVLAGNGSEDRD